MQRTRYQRLYDESTTAIVTMDGSGRVVHCNRMASRLLGRARDELIGTPLLRWLAPRERRLAKEQFLRALHGQATSWHSRLLRPDGTSRPVGVRAVPQGDGTVTSVDALLIEPSRGATYADGDELRSLLENVPGQFGLILDEQLRIRYACGVARTHWRNDEELTGAEVSLLAAVDAPADEGFRAMCRAIADGRPWNGVQQHVRADGSVFHVQVQAVPRSDHASGVSGTLLLGRDTTEQHALEARLQRAERAAQFGTLASAMMRELETCVEAAGAALQAASGAGSSGGADSVLRRELQRMAAVIERVRAFDAEGSVQPAVASVASIVADVVGNEAATVRDVGVRLTTSLPADLPSVSLNAGHLQRALGEVVRNAIDAVSSARVREIDVDARSEGSNVVVRVRDSGSGLPQVGRERLFEPFATTRQGRLGVGLAIARALLAAHGGTLRLEPGATGGTVAVLELPVRAAASNFRAEPMVLRPGTVLVVDDDAGMRNVLRRILERVGYAVTEAFSGRSALAALESAATPDFIITDLKMSGGTGHWLLQKLRSEHPALLPRTVILTGEPSTEVISRAAASTGCPVLRKPVEFRVLLEVLDEVGRRAGADSRPTPVFETSLSG